ncbi:hypothetical protein ACETK8_14190 [Brevundimonas staleyi]|uniref:DUF2927 domain-containing protein n=1 Tax=Brevundimonas staleyi TaxID=74326 RepID=A0ABW0FV30_9CAUL
MSMSLGLVALLAALQTAPAPSQPAQDESRVGDIVVNGRPLDDLVNDFVSEISRPASRRGLARWHQRVCVGVVNLPAAHAQYMADRISEVAAEVGLQPGEPGCSPRVIIIATDNGAALATSLVGGVGANFNLRTHQTDAGSRALRDFQASDRPVRWWHTSLPVDSETGRAAIRLPGDDQPPTVNVFAASRVNSQVRDDLIRVVIIIDVEKLGDSSFEQLTDYVALVSLAQIDADAQTQGYDTIMNLFNGSGAPSGLTDWDLGYLQALYATHPQRINPNSLTRSVASDVARGIRSGQTAAED